MPVLLPVPVPVTDYTFEPMKVMFRVQRHLSLGGRFIGTVSLTTWSLAMHVPIT